MKAAHIVLLAALFIMIGSCKADTKGDEARHVGPSTRGFSGLDKPGYDQFTFTATGDKPIQVLMRLNKTILTMEAKAGYSQYLHSSEESNLVEFRYYKTCAGVGLAPPSYTTTEDRIVLVLTDASDATLTYRFKLDKILLSPQEKVDLMFEVMSRDIAELKEKLWFLEPDTNKIGKGRFIQSNDPKMVDFIEGASSNYSGTYIKQIIDLKKLFMVGNRFVYCTSECDRSQPIETYGPNYVKEFTTDFLTTRNPLTIRLPRRTIVKKIRFELSNGGSCHYTDSIVFSVKRYYIDSSRPTTKYTTVSGHSPYRIYDSLYLNELLDPLSATTQKKLNDGFVEVEIDNEQYSVVDGLVLMISTNGFTSPSGTVFDGSCTYILRKLVLI